MQAFRGGSCIRASVLLRRPFLGSVRYNSDLSKKYADKLLHKAKAEGLESIEDLKEKYKEHIKEQQKVHDKMDPFKEQAAEGPKDRGKRPEVPPIPNQEIKTLNSYIDLPKLSLHDKNEIGMLWKARFAHKERSLSGVIDEPTYRKIFRNARMNPSFVLPVPHEGQGAELHYLQWAVAGPYTLHCMFTSLAEFKLHNEYARPHTTFAIHSELLQEKKIALMNGDVEKDANVNHAQGAFLVTNVQRFYGVDHNDPDASPSSLRKLKLLHDFTANSSDFTVDKLLEEVETLD